MYIVFHTSKVKTLRDAQTHRSGRRNDRHSLDARVLRPAVQPHPDLKTRLVPGYPGQLELLLAMEKGEIDGDDVAVLVEPEDAAADLVSAEDRDVPVSVWRARRILN